MTNLLPYFLVLFAGMIVPPAVALNAILGRSLKSPVLSGLVVMIIGGLSIAIVALIMREEIPPGRELSKISWFVWGGGFLIALYMLLMNFNVPIVGVGLATSLVLAGQIMTGLAIDHYGLFGLPQASISVGRFFGAVAIIGGVLLVKFF